MRIVSSFKDYYDPIQYLSPYLDGDIEFVRETREEKSYNLNPLKEFGNGRPYDNSLLNHSRKGLIGFCGKNYYYLKNDYDGTKIWLDADSYLDELQCNYKHKYFIRKGTRLFPKEMRISFKTRHVEEIREWFKPDNCDKRFEKYAIFTFDDNHGYDFFSNTHRNYSRTFINPNLSQMGFEKIKPAEQAYQELRMWWSNQAVPQKQILVMSDAIKIEARGFNKFSFRKEKSKK